ncbi:hypothetical protein PR202_gb02788 [Eleusine coracana subsp. coracana]|uniref:Uncharacterized protein n=1 Tax=Eleusine coracana subsp. coracana TaxID=191504 RepID=A0AAV5DZL6_ELECO|nr:hypothetical protein PR202_gb02788 [Eleusine coracana subsp. coracana]
MDLQVTQTTILNKEKIGEEAFEIIGRRAPVLLTTLTYARVALGPASPATCAGVALGPRRLDRTPALHSSPHRLERPPALPTLRIAHSRPSPVAPLGLGVRKAFGFDKSDGIMFSISFDFVMSQYKDKFSTMYLDEEDRVAEWIDSDDDEEYDDESDEDNMSIGNLVDDITAMHVKKHGRDIQGIPFEEAMRGPRDIIRQRRLQEYIDIEDVPNSGKDSKKACNCFYEEISIRQLLRNLVWAETKHDVYLMGHFSVLHWSALTFERQEIIDLLGNVKPSEKHYGNLEEGFFKPEVCSMAIKDNLLLARGMKGEIICKHTSMSPDGKLAIIVGDNIDGLVVDAISGQDRENNIYHRDLCQ